MGSKPGVAFEIYAKPSFRDTKGRWTEAHEELLEEYRNGMRVLGRQLKSLMQSEAPTGKTGKFKRGIRFRTFSQAGSGRGSGAKLGFKITMPQPLGTWIIKGTKPHIIRAKVAKALYFYWGKVGAYTVVPKAGGFKTHFAGGKLWIGKGYVNHPGTKANPFDQRAYDRWWPGAKAFFARISRSFVQRFST